MKLKRDYDIIEVISQFTMLAQEGSHWYRSTDHSSLVIDADTNRFFWTSKGIDGQRAGDVADFYAAYYGVTRDKALEMIRKHNNKSVTAIVNHQKRQGKKVVYERLGWDVAMQHHSNLDKSGYEWWQGRGVAIETVDRLLLGSHKDIDGILWYTIPIPSGDRSYLANYKLRRAGEGKPRYRQLVKGLEATLYIPFPELACDKLVIVGGEIKAIVLGQYGIPAASSSSGASTWNKKWDIRGKEVVICLDPKEHIEGEESYTARRVMGEMTGALSIVERPLPYDPDDAIVKYGWHPNQLKEHFGL